MRRRFELHLERWFGALIEFLIMLNQNHDFLKLIKDHDYS